MADAINSTAHQAFMLSGTLLWGLYESSGAARVAAVRYAATIATFCTLQGAVLVASVVTHFFYQC